MALLNPHDDIGIDVVRETDVALVGLSGLGLHTPAQAFFGPQIIGGVEPNVAIATFTAAQVGEYGNRYVIAWNNAGPASPTVTISGNVFTINYLAGTTTAAQVQTAFNAATTLISLVVTNTTTATVTYTTTRPLAGGVDYHGHWGDGARQYDNGDDTTPGAVTHNGQGWPTWEPNVPNMRCLWFCLFNPAHTEGAGAGNGYQGTQVGTGSSAAALGYDATYGIYRTPTTGSTATGSAGWCMGANSGSLIAPSVSSHVWRNETVFRIPTLSSAADSFIFFTGFGGSIGSVPNSTQDCAMIQVQNGIANFQCITQSGFAQTSVDSGIAVTTGWWRVVVVITNNTKVEFYITPLGTPLPATPTVTSTTNLPGHSMTACTSINKQGGTIGTTPCTFNLLHQLTSWNKLAA